LAVLAKRHHEFLERGGRLFGISSDTPGQNAAVIEKLGLPFPILSDPDRDQAITPLGFADENDPREIARPGVLIIDPKGEVAYRTGSRDYADRLHEDAILDALGELALEPTTQDAPEVGDLQPGERAVPLRALPPYFRGVKYATYALRQRHRDVDDDFADDAKAYGLMADRYLEALSELEARRA
jgi:hypothetical protein